MYRPADRRTVSQAPDRSTGVHQPPPDRRELFDPGAEQVDPLAAGDLRVEPEVAGHLADHDQLLRGDLPAGHARDHRIRAVALQVAVSEEFRLNLRHVKPTPPPM